MVEYALLPRKELQNMAKVHGIRANLSSKAIIDLLEAMDTIVEESKEVGTNTIQGITLDDAISDDGSKMSIDQKELDLLQESIQQINAKVYENSRNAKQDIVTDSIEQKQLFENDVVISNDSIEAIAPTIFDNLINKTQNKVVTKNEILWNPCMKVGQQQKKEHQEHLKRKSFSNTPIKNRAAIVPKMTKAQLVRQEANLLKIQMQQSKMADENSKQQFGGSTKISASKAKATPEFDFIHRKNFNVMKSISSIVKRDENISINMSQAMNDAKQAQLHNSKATSQINSTTATTINNRLTSSISNAKDNRYQATQNKRTL